MSDEVTIKGQQYISSRRASDSTGYSQDYIGQLARSGMINAERVGGLWYVALDSLIAYKSQTEIFKKENMSIGSSLQSDTEALVSFDGKEYISASRASKITGYNKDYIGQLARSSKILSRQVGNRWYVEKWALLEHKRTKDGLLGAVQSQSVGLRSHTFDHSYTISSAPFYSYQKENNYLLPDIQIKQDNVHEVSIRRIHNLRSGTTIVRSTPAHIKHVRQPRKTIQYGMLAASVLTVVVILSIGVGTLKSNSTFAVIRANHAQLLSMDSLSASAVQAFDVIGDILERIFVSELTYTRSSQ